MAKKTDDYTKRSPFISVIVPVYNVEVYLARCIESILNQTYQNLELILVDDGSKDTSLDICHEYKKKDARIKVVQQANAGSSVARNTGLKIAKGEYIGFVDSDDWIRPNMYEDMLQLALNEDVLLVECGHMTSKEIHQSFKTSKCDYEIETQEKAIERIIRAGSFAVWRRFYHKSILEGETFIPGKIHQDVFYTMDVLDKIPKMGIIQEKYYVYNIENESVIRSAYSLKKLDAKDAVYYVHKIASKYSPEIQQLGNRYLIRGLINHFIPLNENPYLDRDMAHRIRLKREIKQNYHLLNKEWSNEKVRAKLILCTPIKIYKVFLWLNRQRIRFKMKLREKLYV